MAGATILDSTDYDGDELMFTLALDNRMASLMYPFTPFFNLLDIDRPYEIGRNASLSDPVMASISAWIQSEKIAG